jgi:uncharacterized Rossmann fold enzyme
MAKIDKTQYTKQQYKILKTAAKADKLVVSEIENVESMPMIESNTAFVLGNGTSRASVKSQELKTFGKVYGCNALYRTFDPDYLIAVDVKMVLEINKAGYQHKHNVWTNPNKSYQKMSNLNFFQPSKGWSSGPTALWLASQHGYEKIFILGFDYKGLDEGKKLNNMYSDTVNYKKSTEGATFFGNWLRQTVSVIKDNPKINFIRVIASDNYIPEELNKFVNVEHITTDTFKKIYSLS